MSLKVGELFAELKLENKGFDQGVKTAHGGLKQVEQQSERTEGGLRRLGSAFQDMAKIAGGFVIAKALIELPQILAGAARGAVMAASDINEAQSKVNVVFGDSARIINDFASTSNRDLGISREAALSAAGTFGNLLTTMGLTQPAAASMSTGIVSLASDLASFNNEDPSIMLEKLRAGLVGEVEPLRSVGVNLNAVMVEAKAMEMGLADANGEVSEGAKVMARHALILEQTGNAQGDFARTSEGMANAGRIIKASLTDLSTELGQRLLPLIEPLVVRFSRWLPDAIDDFAAAFDRVMSTASGFRDWVQGIFSSGDVLGSFLASLPDWFSAMVSNVESMMGIGGHNAIVAYAQGIIDGAASNVQTAINYVTDLIASYLVGQSPPPKGPLSEIDKAGQNLMETYSEGMVEGAKGAESAADTVADAMERVGEKMELDAGRQALEDAAGNLESMEAVAAEVETKLGEIDSELRSIDSQLLQIDHDIADINDKYDEQLEPLQEQLDLLKKQRDLQAEKLQLEHDLASAKVQAAALEALGDPERRAEIAGEMALNDIEQQRLDNSQKLADIQAQLDGGGKDLTAEERERLELQERSLKLSRSETIEKLQTSKDLTSLERARLQLKLDEIDADIRANADKQNAKPEELTDAERRSLELQAEELRLRGTLLDIIDAEAAAQAEADGQLLDSKQKEKDLVGQIADIQTDIAKIPILEEIEKVEAARREELEPLEEQRDLLMEQRESLDYLRQQWQFLAADVDHLLEPLREVARLQEQAAKDAERSAKAAQNEATALERQAEAAARKADAASKDNSFEARQARLAGTGTACPVGWVMDEFGNCVNPAEEADKAAQKAKADAQKEATAPGAPVFDAEAAEALIVGQAVAPPITPTAAGDTLSADMLQPKPEPFGAQMGALFADGFIGRIGELVKQNLGRVMGASIGAALGGLALGALSGGALAPLGAAIGGLLGGLIGDSLQDKLAGHNFDFGSVAERITESFDEYVRPVFDRFHEWLVGGQENVQSFGDTVRGIFDNYIAPALQRISDDLLPAFQEAWGRIRPTIEPAIQNVARLAEWVSDQIDVHWGTISAVTEAVWAFVSRYIGDVIGQASRVISAVLLVIGGDWQGAWQQVKDFLRVTWEGISDLVRLGIKGVQKFIDDALPVIWAKLLQWGAAFVDWIEPRIDPMLAQLGDLLSRFGSWIIDTALPEIWAKLSEWGSAFIDWVGPKIPVLLEELGRLNQSLVDWIGGTAAPAIIEKLKVWGAAFLDWIKDDVLPYLWARAQVIADDLQTWVTDVAAPTIKEKLKTWAAAFLDWIAEGVLGENGLVSKLGGVARAIFEWIGDKSTGATSLIKTKLLEFAAAFVDWVSETVLGTGEGSLVDKLAGILTAISTWVTDNLQTVKDSMEGIGTGIVEGIWEGIKSMGDWLKEKLTGFVTDNIPGVIKDALLERSPSRATMPSGVNAVRGIMTGMESEEGALAAQARKLASIVIGGASSMSIPIPRVSSQIAMPAAAMAASSALQSTASDRRGGDRSGDIIIPIYDSNGGLREKYIVDVMNKHARKVYG